MSKPKHLYHYTSPVHSAERMGLYKLEEVIKVLDAVLTKLDNDSGVTETDYKDLSNRLQEIRDNIRIKPNDVKGN